MFDVKIVQKNKVVYIAVFYEEKWYAKACIAANGEAIPGDEYEELTDEGLAKLLPKLPSVIQLITKQL